MWMERAEDIILFEENVLNIPESTKHLLKENVGCWQCSCMLASLCFYDRFLFTCAYSVWTLTHSHGEGQYLGAPLLLNVFPDSDNPPHTHTQTLVLINRSTWKQGTLLAEYPPCWCSLIWFRKESMLTLHFSDLHAWIRVMHGFLGDPMLFSFFFMVFPLKYIQDIMGLVWNLEGPHTIFFVLVSPITIYSRPSSRIWV